MIGPEVNSELAEDSDNAIDGLDGQTPAATAAAAAAAAAENGAACRICSEATVAAIFAS